MNLQVNYECKVQIENAHDVYVTQIDINHVLPDARKFRIGNHPHFKYYRIDVWLYDTYDKVTLLLFSVGRNIGHRKSFSSFDDALKFIKGILLSRYRRDDSSFNDALGATGAHGGGAGGNGLNSAAIVHQCVRQLEMRITRLEASLALGTH